MLYAVYNETSSFWEYLFEPYDIQDKVISFLFLFREESRMHVHVMSPNGEAKFWLEPELALAQTSGFSAPEINELQKILEEHRDELATQWHRHFGS